MHILLNRIIFLLFQKEVVKARHQYTEALKLNPKNRVLHENMLKLQQLEKELQQKKGT